MAHADATNIKGIIFVCLLYIPLQTKFLLQQLKSTVKNQVFFLHLRILIKDSCLKSVLDIIIFNIINNVLFT